MSLLRMPKFQRIGTSWESIADFFSGRNRRRPAGGHNRRLMIDPLEQRMLLSVSIGNANDQTVSQTLGSQTTGTAEGIAANRFLFDTGTAGTQAVASDHNGDFVVAWTRYDPLIDPETGQQVRDPLSGSYMTEGNIYARYFTDEVQRITLPAQMLMNSGTQLPAFSLLYGGNAVQKISISQVYPSGSTTAGTVQGVFSLGYDLNGDGMIDPVTETTRPIQFDEAAFNSPDPTVNPAVLMQNALRALGGPLSDVTVTALNSHDYEVDFGDASQGQAMRTIAALNPAWPSGRLPPITVDVVRQPIQIGINASTGGPRIYVSSTDVSLTAQSIQTAFSAANWSANGLDPVTVQVTPVNNGVDNPLLTFDITFVGNSGKTDQPQLVFGKMSDASGNSISVDSLNVFNVKTLKEPSPEFRVNPPEPDNPFTVGPDQYEQTDPAVAMDADGDYVITWTSVVPDSVTPGSQTDVFARRFSPSALITKPNMVISSHTLSVLEGNSNTITVMLDSQPLSNLTVTISKESGGDPSLTADKSTLTFTPGNWNQAQTVKFSAATDSNNVNETANFDVSIPGYATQVVNVTDIDTKSLIVSSDNVSVPEGAYNGFTVKLASAPTANVTVNVATVPGGDADLTISGAPLALTFTPGNWNTAQMVTINAANDADTTNGTAVISLTPDVASGYGSRTVNLTEIDKDLNSIMLSAETLSVVEGRSNSFTVALSSAPSGFVEVDILKRADSSSDITSSASTLYFDSFNWNLPRTVTLNAPLEATVNNGTAYFYVYAPYNPEYAFQTVTANEIGVGQFVVSQSFGSIIEGTAGTVTVALTGQPTSTVTVSIIKQAGGDPDLTLAFPASGTLTFNPGNWNSPQTIYISAANDPDAVDGTAVFYLDAPGYISQPIAVAELDTTAPPNLVINLVNPSPPPLTTLLTDPAVVPVAENGNTSITVALPVRPPSDVTLTITKEAGGDPGLTVTTPASQTLSFTPANYNVGQTITFHDAPDADAINGVAVFYLDVPGYARQKIFVSELDTTKSADITVGYPPASNRIVVVPEGGTNTFTVVLTTTPAVGADVTVTLTAQAISDADLTVAPATLTFTNANNTPQTVTVTAAVDADTADGIAYFDLTAPGLITQTVTLIENDNTPMDLVITPRNLFVPEGGTNTFTVALSNAPTANVTVTIGKQINGDPDLTNPNANLVTGLQTLTFTPANWNTPQTVTINAAEDADNTDGTSLFYVSSVGITTQVVTAMELDNDVPDVKISNSNTSFVPIQDISVLEGDAVGHTFYVSLPSSPTYDLTVNIDKQPGGDAAISTNKTTLTFTADVWNASHTVILTHGNWNTPQAVKITSANDANAINGTADFYISAIGYTVQAIAVTQIDVNASPVVILSDTASVPEGGFKLFPIKLAYKPISDVTVAIAPEPGGDADLSATPATFTFTSSNWYIPQTLIFCDAEDPDTVNGTAIFDITATTPTSEGTTTPVTTFPILTVTANEVDNDSNTLIVSTDLVQILEGTTGTFTITLPNQPTSDVTVTIARQAGGDPNLRAIPTTLTFSSDPNAPNAWNKPQAVKILSSSDPDIVNGAAQFLISAWGYVSTTVTASDLDYVQGARPLGNAFRVNTYTPNKQYNASVSMDNDGNFVVSWTDEGQFTSFFNNIQAQRFDRDGNRIGSQFQVNPESTASEYESYASMSPDGHFLITWVEARSGDQPEVVMAKVWDQQGQVIANQFDVDLGFAPTAAWDTGNNYVITFDRINWGTPPVNDNQLDVDRPAVSEGSIYSGGVYQIRYSIVTDATGAVTSGNTVTLPLCRVNSAWTDPTNSSSAGYITSWPYYQGNNQVAIDADGDITTVFDGYGAESDYTLNLDDTINNDLWNAQLSGLTFQDVSLLQTYYPYVYQNLIYGSKATDAQLADLNNALQLYYYSTYNSILKQTNAIYGTMYEPNGYIRGEPNGVQFSQFDAFRVVNPDGSVNMNFDMSGVQSDVVANSMMDGHDAQYILGIDPLATTGSFTLAVTNAETTDNNSTTTNITIVPTYLPNGGPVDVTRTATAIQNALNGITVRLGSTATTNQAVVVRLITALEISNRSGTHWPLNNTPGYQYYEITFSYLVHNLTDLTLATAANPYTMQYTVPGATQPVAALFPLVSVLTAPDPGTVQEYSSIAMQPSGNFVVVWTQSDRYSNGSASFTDLNRNQSELLGTSIHYRTYTESTDTAGPLATDFILTDGTRLRNGGQVNQPLQYMVVSFDEPMMTTGASSVTDPRNWALMKDGTVINGGISKIYYGLNMASQLGQSGLSQFSGLLNSSASNRYEAVIILDGNGMAAGTPALVNGHYQIVALNSLRDVAGNPLGRTGYNLNGNNFSRSFDVAVPYGTESIVNITTAGSQTTSSNVQGLADDGNGQVVASDGNGDSVAVWTSNTAGKEGVYARMYTVTWTLNGSTRQNATVPGSEIFVSADPYASNAAAAMDGDGDFVVTWSSDIKDPGDSTTSWDVYARRYNATGQALSDVFMVNSYTPDIQRNSSVAMDAQGDFVITWQSMNQDGSGYGIYAQRYSPSGIPLDGNNETQEISLIGRPKGTLALHWEGDSNPNNNVSPVITLQGLQGEAPSLVGQIQNALDAMGITAIVTAISGTDILINFYGIYTDVDVPQITIDHSSLTGDAGFQFNITTQAQGVSGEIRVNDTTVGDQVDPSIAMNDRGDMAVTWTGYGQDGDAPYQSNIYVKNFAAPTTSNFDITLRFGGGLTPSQEAIFDMAASRWESIIIGDIPDVISPLVGYVDDVMIDASGVFIDGPGGILGQAGPQEFRNVSFLPDYGIMQFDTADLADMQASGQLLDVITHEMAHVLGFGTIWTNLGVYVNGSGQYTGAAALAAYQSEFVGQQNATFVPVELGGGPGTADGHWNEVDGGAGPTGIVDTQGRDMEFELMTGWLNSPTFISQTTAYQFQDLGYVVNAGAALNLPQLSYSNPSPITGWMENLTGPRSYVDALPANVGGGNSTARLASLPEARVNTTIANDQKWSSVAIDANGDFVVTWTSYGQDGGGNGYGAGVNGQNGVYARRFNANGSAGGNEFKVNAFTANNQQHSQVAMDVAGDFVITWESFQDRPSVGSGQPDLPNSYGIYAQRYARASQIGVSLLLGPNGEVGTEFRLNSTTDGDQRYPSVAMDATGDIIAVWSGNGLGDPTGIFSQRYNNLNDTAGPFVTEVSNYSTSGGVSTLTPIYTGATIVDPISQFVITFDENLNTTYGPGGTHSITNLSNWQLTQNGVAVRNGVASVQFDLNQAHKSGLANADSGKYEAVVTFDIDPNTAGNQALTTNTPGQYALTISDNVQDIFGNALDGNLDSAPGGNYVFSVLIPTQQQTGPQPPPTVTPPGPPSAPGTPNYTGDTIVNTNQIGLQDQPAVASDAIGEYVVVWTTDAADGSSDIMAQRFDKYGRMVGSQTIVSSFTAGNQSQPDVAMDPLGNFVVAWAGYGADDDVGVYARIFDTFGKATGDQFRVNQFRTNIQDLPRVAMDPNSDFVVSWTSYGQAVPSEPSVGDIYARRYNILGKPQSDEFLVNSSTTRHQTLSDVAMDSKGDFAIVWESDQQDGSSFGIYGQRYNSAGQRSGGEFQINSYTNDKQVDPRVAMDSSGDFVATWSSFGQDGSGYGVYAQRFNSAGARLGTEFRVNQTTPNWQYQPSVSMDNAGDFVITWSTFGQDTDLTKDYGIYARMYKSNGSDYINPASGSALGEFRVNAFVIGNQMTPDVAMDSDGDYVTVWAGPDIDVTGVYCRVIAVNTSTYTPVASVTTNGQFYGVPYIDSTNPAPTPNTTPTFTLTGPISGSYVSGQSITIAWSAANVSANDIISLCLDTDTTLWNGNEKWIEIDKVTATNGNGSYTFDPAGFAPGTYYVGGYMYDKVTYVFTNAHLTSTITIPAPTFALSSPTSGSYASGHNITITWTAANVSANDIISLCLDTDTTLWNGNEKWIEIDKVTATNGNGSYTFDPAGFAPGTYYVGGYMYDKVSHVFTNAHLTAAITIPAPPVQSFALSGPTSGTFAAGQNITITWTAANVSANDVITLCLDTDTTLWNGNEKWIEIDKVTATNGNGSYAFNPAGFPSGTYYAGGYMYDKVTHVFTNSHLTAPITIPAPPVQSFALSGPTSGTFAPGQNITITWTAANVSANDVITLCLDADKTLWNGNEKWIEIDKVAAANGNGSYAFDPTGFAPGTYYVGGYMYDKVSHVFTNAHLTSAITIPAPSFTLSGPTSGTFAPGQNITITWTAANVSANDVITLCLDADKTLWNGNEKWIEIDKVAAANGNGSYAFDPTGFAPGTYYVGGYMYDKVSHVFTNAHLTAPITIPAPTFTLNGPASGQYTVGQPVTITWTAANASANSVISLCFDTDTTLWNSNDHWIEIDKVSAANGGGSYAWDTTGVAPGTYYIGGYMYDKVTHVFSNAHLLQSFTIVAASPQSQTANLAALTGNLGGLIGAPAAQGGTDGASLVDNTSSLAVTSKDLVFSSAELTPSSASQRVTDAGGADNQDNEELLALADKKEELSAVDAALQDQDTWLDKSSANWLA